jgi:hypothetical protein
MKQRIYYFVGVTIVPILTMSIMHGSAEAAAVRSLFSHHHWQVLATKEHDKQLCYLFSAPTKSSGTFKKRGEAFIFVNDMGNDHYEFSASSGYPYKEKEGSVTVLVDKNRFKTVTKNATAWMVAEKQDAAIIKAMARHDNLHVLGTSKANTTSDDTYSLRGFKASFEWMKRHCNKSKK